ncbi:hypothetical protein GCM10017044_10740 [Kordiimonas sediminis]|uniref:Uncharacterized protein n=1 Tax=Kordiimonas sediminis TaxID=1735581 RepID=A0A919E686_9PROT|nr:hypothetical protein [Kordiimonas sediminis]GHF18082.1 hypothetical protein GCM10017044_10740 [Kordiimonas sediminis]
MENIQTNSAVTSALTHFADELPVWSKSKEGPDRMRASMTVSDRFHTPLTGQPRTIADREVRAHTDDRSCLSDFVEHRLVEATWTLRRLPDKEAGFLYSRRVLWPETVSGPEDYPNGSLSLLEARKHMRLSAAQIDRMEPSLDILRCLPDREDRRIVFWGAWHQDGEQQPRIPWAKVRRSLGSDLSRWTLKRRYQNGLDWLVANILTKVNASAAN